MFFNKFMSLFFDLIRSNINCVCSSSKQHFRRDVRLQFYVLRRILIALRVKWIDSFELNFLKFFSFACFDLISVSLKGHPFGCLISSMSLNFTSITRASRNVSTLWFFPEIISLGFGFKFMVTISIFFSWGKKNLPLFAWKLFGKTRHSNRFFISSRWGIIKTYTWTHLTFFTLLFSYSPWRLALSEFRSKTHSVGVQIYSIRIKSNFKIRSGFFFCLKGWYKLFTCLHCDHLSIFCFLNSRIKSDIKRISIVVALVDLFSVISHQFSSFIVHKLAKLNFCLHFTTVRSSTLVSSESKLV